MEEQFVVRTVVVNSLYHINLNIDNEQMISSTTASLTNF